MQFHSGVVLCLKLAPLPRSDQALLQHLLWAPNLGELVVPALYNRVKVLFWSKYAMCLHPCSIFIFQVSLPSKLLPVAVLPILMRSNYLY